MAREPSEGSLRRACGARGYFTVHLRTPGGNPIELPGASLAYHTIAIRPRWIDFCNQDFFFFVVCGVQKAALRIDDLGVTGEPEATLFAHAVCCDHHHVVLGGANEG